VELRNFKTDSGIQAPGGGEEPALPPRLPPVELREAKSARAGLIGLAIAAGVFNLLAFPLVRASAMDRGAILFLGPLMFGVLSGELAAMAQWLVWGEGTFLRRLAVHWAVGMALLGCLLLGGLAAMADTATVNSEMLREAAIPLSLIPSFSLATQLPLWPLRTHLGWAVESTDRHARLRRLSPLSILDILSGTAVVALSLGLVRAAPFPDREFISPWIEIVIGLLIVAVLSLVTVLPAVLFILRFKEGGLGCAVFAGYILMAVIVLFAISATVFGGGAFIDGDAVFAALLAASSFAATLAAPLLVMRAAGYRLVWPRDRRTPTS
jgi:hypothetical protein